MASDKRPTSPHLTIYRPQISSVLSIAHRLSGVWLFFGALLMVAWLYVVAYAPASYPAFYECLSSWIGELALLGWTAAFYYHLSNGIRHLFWDMGYGFSVPKLHLSGWLVILFTLLMTLITWGFVGAAAGVS